MEIVISVTILGILTVSFFSVFTSGFIGISSSGGKTNAMTVASSKMEQAYTLSAADFLLNNVDLGNKLGVTVVDNANQLHEYNAVTNIKCMRKDQPLAGVSGYIVTIAVFYDNGKNYAEISSFVKV